MLIGPRMTTPSPWARRPVVLSQLTIAIGHVCLFDCSSFSSSSDWCIMLNKIWKDMVYVLDNEYVLHNENPQNKVRDI